MKRLEENLQYFGSGSVAGIEALARLAAAGAEIGFDPEAMGGGDDPLADYFGKVEAAGEDQTNKFLQWADTQIQRGAKTVKIQEAEISLVDYRARLEGIQRRKISHAALDKSGLSLKDEVSNLINRQKAEEQASREREKAEVFEKFTPQAIVRELTIIQKENPALQPFVTTLKETNSPFLMSEVASYLTSGESDRKLGEIMWYEGPFYRLLGKNIGTIKKAPDLHVRTLGLDTIFTGNIKDSLLEIGDIPVIVESPEEKFVGVSVEIKQKRTPKYVAVQYGGSGLKYPAREGDEFWRDNDTREIIVSIQAGNLEGKSTLSVKSNTQSGIEHSFSQPSENELKRALIDILARLEE